MKLVKVHNEMVTVNNEIVEATVLKIRDILENFEELSEQMSHTELVELYVNAPKH